MRQRPAAPVRHRSIRITDMLTLLHHIVTLPSQSSEIFPTLGKNIMWSSDHPHSHQLIAQNFRGLSKAERNWIIAGYAEKVFGLN